MLFFNFFSFNLRNNIFQSAKKCEMTSFYMTSLLVDLNEAAKCFDIIPLTLLVVAGFLGPNFLKQGSFFLDRFSLNMGGFG